MGCSQSTSRTASAATVGTDEATLVSPTNYSVGVLGNPLQVPPLDISSHRGQDRSVPPSPSSSLGDLAQIVAGGVAGMQLSPAGVSTVLHLEGMSEASLGSGGRSPMAGSLFTMSPTGSMRALTPLAEPEATHSLLETRRPEPDGAAPVLSSANEWITLGSSLRNGKRTVVAVPLRPSSAGASISSAEGEADPLKTATSLREVEVTQQQCFIKAIECDASNHHAWYNLGQSIPKGGSVPVPMRLVQGCSRRGDDGGECGSSMKSSSEPGLVVGRLSPSRSQRNNLSLSSLAAAGSSPLLFDRAGHSSPGTASGGSSTSLEESERPSFGPLEGSFLSSTAGGGSGRNSDPGRSLTGGRASYRCNTSDTDTERGTLVFSHFSPRSETHRPASLPPLHSSSQTPLAISPAAAVPLLLCRDENKVFQVSECYCFAKAALLRPSSWKAWYNTALSMKVTSTSIQVYHNSSREVSASLTSSGRRALDRQNKKKGQSSAENTTGSVREHALVATAKLSRVDCLTKAAELHPTFQPIWYLLGLVMPRDDVVYVAEDPHSKVTALVRSIELRPDHSKSWYALANRISLQREDDDRPIVLGKAVSSLDCLVFALSHDMQNRRAWTLLSKHLARENGSPRNKSLGSRSARILDIAYTVEDCLQRASALRKVEQ